MGGGKTTLGKTLSNKYSCPVIDTDDIHTKLSKHYPDDKFPSSKRYPLFKQEVERLLKYNNKLIISGVGISRIFINELDLRELLLSKSFIFLGKSALISSWDAINRELKRKDQDKNIFQIISITKGNFGNFYEREIQLRNARISIKGSNVQEYR